MPRFREGLAELQAFYERILEQAFGVSEGVWLGTPFNLNLERDAAPGNGAAGDLASAFGVVGREGWLDCACRSQDDGSGHAGRLITMPGIGHSMDLESPARYAGYLAHGSAGLPEMKSRFSFALKVHLRQPVPVQQHDLPLGLAEEAENTHAVKM